MTTTTPDGVPVDRLLVKPDVKRIFEYRRRTLLELFGARETEGV